MSKVNYNHSEKKVLDDFLDYLKNTNTERIIEWLYRDGYNIDYDTDDVIVSWRDGSPMPIDELRWYRAAAEGMSAIEWDNHVDALSEIWEDSDVGECIIKSLMLSGEYELVHKLCVDLNVSEYMSTARH